MSINKDLVEDLYIDTMDITEALLNNVVSESEREEFDAGVIEEMVYDIYVSARNEYNRDCYRAFYNLLQAIARDSMIPF